MCAIIIGMACRVTTVMTVMQELASKAACVRSHGSFNDVKSRRQAYL